MGHRQLLTAEEEWLMQITDSSIDPVFVRHGVGAGKVELRIGKERPGQTRYARLSPREARKVAYALLAASEDAEAKSN